MEIQHEIPVDPGMLHTSVHRKPVTAVLLAHTLESEACVFRNPLFSWPGGHFPAEVHRQVWETARLNEKQLGES